MRARPQQFCETMKARPIIRRSSIQKIFGFKVSVNALTMQHANKGESGSQGGGMHGGGGMGGGMHGGGGGMRGGGMHGGGGHSGNGNDGTADRSSLFKATNFMSRIKLVLPAQRK